MGTKVVTVEDTARVSKITRQLPWFNCEPGFKFIYDGSPAMVIGWGSWRKWEDLGEVRIKEEAALIADWYCRPGTIVCAYLYKGEWHMSDIEIMTQDCVGAVREVTKEESWAS